MDKFDQREQAYENKFAHEAEINFLITAKANKYLALWAAKIMNMAEIDARKYADDFVEDNIENFQDINQFISRLSRDFTSKNIAMRENEILRMYDELKDLSYEEIMKQ